MTDCVLSVDHSSRSSLALCACGWRSLRSTLPAAWHVAAQHATRAHGDRDESQRALRARNNALVREARRPRTVVDVS